MCTLEVLDDPATDVANDHWLHPCSCASQMPWVGSSSGYYKYMGTIISGYYRCYRGTIMQGYEKTRGTTI